MQLALHDLFEGSITPVPPTSTNRIRRMDMECIHPRSGDDARLASSILCFNLFYRASLDWTAVDQPGQKALQDTPVTYSHRLKHRTIEIQQRTMKVGVAVQVTPVR